MSRTGTIRPLRSGSCIVNMTAGRPGTLECLAFDSEGAPWLVSCYRVIGRVRGATSPFCDDEPIWQSTSECGVALVARTALSHADESLDVAVARVVSGVAVYQDVVELPSLTSVGRAAPGMRVLKSGAATGVTEGIVRQSTIRSLQSDCQTTCRTPTYSVTMGTPAQYGNVTSYTYRPAGSPC